VSSPSCRPHCLGGAWRHRCRSSALATLAERAGNSVEVLLSRYAKCIDGRQEVANRRIEDLLREYE